MKACTVRYEPQRLGQQNRMHVQVMHDFPVDGTVRPPLRLGADRDHGRRRSAATSTSMARRLCTRPMVIDRTQGERLRVASRSLSRKGRISSRHSSKTADAGYHGRQALPHRDGGHRSLPIPSRTRRPRAISASSSAVRHAGGARLQYTREILARLAHRAYRRPVTTAEIDPLLRLAQLVRSHGGEL